MTFFHTLYGKKLIIINSQYIKYPFKVARYLKLESAVLKCVNNENPFAVMGFSHCWIITIYYHYVLLALFQYTDTLFFAEKKTRITFLITMLLQAFHYTAWVISYRKDICHTQIRFFARNDVPCEGLGSLPG